MFEKVQQMVAEHLSINKDKIKPESDFITDLEADSLDIVEMLISLEDTFGIEFEDSEMVDIKTVQDVVNFIESHK
jgi:acyl carrier protein